MNIIGAKKPANYFHLRYIPQAVGELVYSLVCTYRHAMCVCSHTASIPIRYLPIQYLPVQYQIHHLVQLNLQCKMSLHLMLKTVNKVRYVSTYQMVFHNIIKSTNNADALVVIRGLVHTGSILPYLADGSYSHTF